MRPDSQIPFDVFPIHTYASTAGDQGTSSTGNVYAIPFEELLTKHSGKEIIELLDFRDRFMPSKEIWVNEFGYGEAGILGTSSTY